jgi:hypothetical protein
MIVLLVVGIWIFVVSIITGLCVAARAGDQWLAVSARSEDPLAGPLARTPGVHASARLHPADSSAARLRRDGVAA